MSSEWIRAALRARVVLAALVNLLVIAASPRLVRAEEPADSSDLANLSLEQLGNVEVTSVSRRRERLAEVPASIYVITAEDIRRSGVKTIPEALRLCPTLEVARADANQYAVSARGFDLVLANKMLVLIDGRTVYSPLFSGVFWEAQDILLADVDRIEIVTGPAGTSWGTNAVNGVINIVSRAATETKGALASAGGGNDLLAGEARYGWGKGPFFRVYGKAVKQFNSDLETGPSVTDASHRFLGGLRARWKEKASTFYVDAGGYRNDIDQLPDDRVVSGYHLQGNWERQAVSGPAWQAQAYYERSLRDQPAAIHDALNTWDLSAQSEFKVGIHSVVAGAGYRYQPDNTDNLNPPALALIPDDHILHYGYVFGEDAVRFLTHFQGTAGVRFEHNGYTGWETLPTLRLSWHPKASHFLWVGASRAVRAPSRVDREFFVPGTPPHLFLDGGPNFDSEILKSVELGYRAQPFSALSYSLSGYVGNYDRLRSLEPTPSGLQFGNGYNADVRGLEGWANFRVTDSWRLSGGGFLLHQKFTKDPESNDVGGTGQLGSDPDNGWTLRTAFDLGEKGEADVWGRHVGPLSQSTVPGYTSLNARLGWRIQRQIELSVSGYDLVGPLHAEWGATGNRAVFGRTYFGQVQYRL